MANLAEGLAAEMTRCRELLVQYKSFPEGFFAAGMLENALQRANQAATSGDVVAMMQSYEELKAVE